MNSFSFLSLPRPTRAARHVARRNADVYFASWKSNLLPPLLEPVLWIAALGFGLGLFVRDVGGVPYVVFLAPAIIAIEAMNASFFECGYGSFVRMNYQKTYDAITSTPLSLDDVVMGEFLWGAAKAAMNAVFVVAVIAAFGLFAHPALLLAVPVAILVGFVFGAIGILTSALAPGFDSFNYPMYLFITPQMFLSGTFFPLSEFPPVMQQVAYALPLTHATILMRALAAGEWSPAQWLSLAFLVVVAFVFTVVAMNAMKRRLIA